MTPARPPDIDEMLEIIGSWIDFAEPVWLRIRLLAQRLFEAERLAAASEALRVATDNVASTAYTERIRVKLELIDAREEYEVARAAYREGRRR